MKMASNEVIQAVWIGSDFSPPGSGELCRYDSSAGIADRTPITRRITLRCASVIVRSSCYGFRRFRKKTPRGVTGSGGFLPWNGSKPRRTSAWRWRGRSLMP